MKTQIFEPINFLKSENCENLSHFFQQNVSVYVLFND